MDNLDWEKNCREEHGLKNSHHTLTVDDFDDENNFNTYYRVRADNSEAQITTVKITKQNRLVRVQ